MPLLKTAVQFPCGSTGTSFGSYQVRNLHDSRMSCHSSLSKTILQCTLEGGWCCGWLRKCWMDNIKEWTYLPMPKLPTMASCRKSWKRISAESSLASAWWCNRSRVWTELILDKLDGWETKYYLPFARSVNKFCPLISQPLVLLLVNSLQKKRVAWLQKLLN